jgi:hypothetical protein
LEYLNNLKFYHWIMCFKQHYPEAGNNKTLPW